MTEKNDMMFLRPILLLVLLLVLPARAISSSPSPDQVLSLEANPENGQAAYSTCTRCHGTEGWGAYSGEYPQIAGQHTSVIVKQISDIYAGRRDNPAMLSAAAELVDRGPQAMVDVAAYINGLKMNPDPDVGEFDDADLGQSADLYTQVCSHCHGVSGEGNAEEIVPLLQGQNYSYLLRQLQRIQAGTRKNANPEMRKLISGLSEPELEMMATYISRLEPPEEKLAPYGWVNPDFR